MSVIPLPESVSAHFERVLDGLPEMWWILLHGDPRGATGARRWEVEQDFERRRDHVQSSGYQQIVAEIQDRLSDAAQDGRLEAVLMEVLPGPMYGDGPHLPGHDIPQWHAELAAGQWFLSELAAGRCHQISWASRIWPMMRVGGALADSGLPICDTWEVPRWVVSAVESHFARLGDFDGTAQALRFLKGAWPREMSDSGESWDIIVGDRVDELIAHAALLEGRWDEAWSYRHVGLLWGGMRLSIDDILLVRALCESTTLVPTDVHLLTLSGNGLTDFGNAHLDEVNESLDAQLRRRRDQDGTNFVAAAAAKYLGRRLESGDFEEMADEVDYVATPAKLKKTWTHDTIRAGQRRFYSKPLIPTATRHATRHLADSGGLGYLADLAPLTHPNVDSVAFLAERERQRNETHPRPSPPIEVVTVRVSEVVQEELHYDFIPTPGWFEKYARLLGAALLRRSENEVRDAHGVPAIGAGWVGESELYDLVRSAFPDQVVLRHARPEWLTPQHLDVFVPGIPLALEYQGTQHQEPVDFFGGEAAFRKQQQRDRKKRAACQKAGCALIEVLPGYDSEVLLDEVRARAAQADLEL